MQPLHGTVDHSPSFHRPPNLSRPSRDTAIQGETVIGAYQIFFDERDSRHHNSLYNEYVQEVIGQQWIDTLYFEG